MHEMCKSYCNQINILKRMRHLPSKVLEFIYFKTIIPRVTFSISVWGSCSPANFAEIDRLHLRVAEIIHSLPMNIKECDILQHVHWQSLGYIYKRRIATEMFKAKHMLNRLSLHVKTTASKRKGKLMEVPRKSLELGRDSLLFRGLVVWNCLDKNARECENIDTFKRVLKISTNKAALEVSFVKGNCMNYNKDLDDFVILNCFIKLIGSL